jgi:hypothetical protein
MAYQRWNGENQSSIAKFHLDPQWVVAFLSSLLLGRRRSFVADSLRLCTFVRPEPQVEDAQLIPRNDSFVLVTNHYFRPGYNMWWGMAAIGVAVSHVRGPMAEVTWIVANRWTYPDRLRARIVTPASLVVFRRLARMYGFISMPPMPPRPELAEEAVDAMRQALALAGGASEQSPVILGLAPEGGDSSDGMLMLPPTGVGRFMAHLARRGLSFAPVGVFEEEGQLTARFGPEFVPNLGRGATRPDLDRVVTDQVMSAIARLLPERLRGPWASASTSGSRYESEGLS